MQDGSIHPDSASSPYILFIADGKSPIMPGTFYSGDPGSGYLLPFIGGQDIAGGEVWGTEATAWGHSTHFGGEGRSPAYLRRST